MHKATLTLILLIFSFSIYGQIDELNGIIIDHLNKPVPFAKVVLQKGNVIVNGATTDFDGKYLIRNISQTIDSLNLEIKPFECYQGRKLQQIVLENDTTVQPIVLVQYNCDSLVETQCKFHNDSCDVYEVKYYWDSPRNKRKYRKMEKENEKIVYMLTEYYFQECCEKKYYCKTHKYRY